MLYGMTALQSILSFWTDDLAYGLLSLSEQGTRIDFSIQVVEHLIQRMIQMETRS
jgi:hypothetical protein